MRSTIGTEPDPVHRQLEVMAGRVEVLEQSVSRLTELLVDRLPANIVNPYASAKLPDREGFSIRDPR